MSKVIRIDDETFSRLQNIAEPLIDTPSDIIVRLLNYFETSISQDPNLSICKKEQNPVSNNTHKEKTHNIRGHNLFLAPAMDENINKTIRSSISLREVHNFLSEEEIYKLKTKSPDVNRLHCWAMTESRKTIYDSMNEEDVVLFTLKNSGRFEFYGEVTCKIDNERLGKYLWDFVPGKPWSLIYFLKNLSAIDIDKTRLVEALSYKNNYNVPGVVKVNRINLEIAMNRYGNLENLIKSLRN